MQENIELSQKELFKELCVLCYNCNVEEVKKFIERNKTKA